MYRYNGHSGFLQFIFLKPIQSKQSFLIAFSISRIILINRFFLQLFKFFITPHLSIKIFFQLDFVFFYIGLNLCRIFWLNITQLNKLSLNTYFPFPNKKGAVSSQLLCDCRVLVYVFLDTLSDIVPMFLYDSGVKFVCFRPKSYTTLLRVRAN